MKSAPLLNSLALLWFPDQSPSSAGDQIGIFSPLSRATPGESGSLLLRFVVLCGPMGSENEFILEKLFRYQQI